MRIPGARVRYQSTLLSVPAADANSTNICCKYAGSGLGSYLIPIGPRAGRRHRRHSCSGLAICLQMRMLLTRARNQSTLMSELAADRSSTQSLLWLCREQTCRPRHAYA